MARTRKEIIYKMRLDNKNFTLFICKGVGSNFNKDNELNQITNADKIRSMTDEELADFMVNGTNIICKECPLKNDYCDGNICKNRALKWLKQNTK